MITISYSWSLLFGTPDEAITHGIIPEASAERFEAQVRKRVQLITRDECQFRPSSKGIRIKGCDKKMEEKIRSIILQVANSGKFYQFTYDLSR